VNFAKEYNEVLYFEVCDALHYAIHVTVWY